MASQTSAARYSRVPPQEPSTSTVPPQEPSDLMDPPQVQIVSIRAPKNLKKKFNVMRFNRGLNIDFNNWQQMKMYREDNRKEFKSAEEEMPTFGAGSEFGRAAREQARRRRFAINQPKYNPANQPWILQNTEKNGKKYKGVKGGGVTDHAAYYIFTEAADGAMEAYPLHEWYNFQMVPRYKTLSAEEAEEEFSKRGRVLNHFDLMLKKRLQSAKEDAEKKGKGSNKKKEKDFKISEMDEWIDSDDDSNDSDDNDKGNRKRSDDEDDDSKKKKKIKNLKKKKKRDYDDEAFEESDDGDEEGRELDYISDSSASESELEQQKDIKSVAEEKALKQLLDSGDEDEDEDENKEKEKKKIEDDNEEGKEKNDKGKKKSGKSNGKEASKKKATKKETSDSSNMENISGKNKGVASPSRKRKVDSPINTTQCKKLKTENNKFSTSYIPGASESGITVEAVKRYLMRKPMTTTDLLQKFKAKKTGLSSETIVTIMTAILIKVNPTKHKIYGKTYFSIEKAS